MPRPTERASEVEAGLAVLDASRRDGVDVALAEQDVVPAVQLDLAAVLRVEEEALAHRRGRGDEDAAAGAPLALVLEGDEDAVVQHPDGQSGRRCGSILPGHGSGWAGRPDQRRRRRKPTATTTTTAAATTAPMRSIRSSPSSVWVAAARRSLRPCT